MNGWNATYREGTASWKLAATVREEYGRGPMTRTVRMLLLLVALVVVSVFLMLAVQL